MHVLHPANVTEDTASSLISQFDESGGRPALVLPQRRHTATMHCPSRAQRESAYADSLCAPLWRRSPAPRSQKNCACGLEGVFGNAGNTRRANASGHIVVRRGGIDSVVILGLVDPGDVVEVLTVGMRGPEQLI